MSAQDLAAARCFHGHSATPAGTDAVGCYQECDGAADCESGSLQILSTQAEMVLVVR